jgi:hypothetical protein
MLNKKVILGALAYLILSIILISTASTASAVSMYSWVGKNGVTNYASNPPKNAKDVQEISGVPVYPQQATTAIVKHSNTSNKAVSSTSRLHKALVLSRMQYMNALRSYQVGKGQRTGNEHNYASYLARIKMLKNRVESSALQVGVIQKEMRIAAKAEQKKTP